MIPEVMFNETYKTIATSGIGVFKDKGSVFTAYAFPVSSESSVKEAIGEVKSKHPDANHHCFAFRLGPDYSAFRYSDDREPSGSAGKPIYGVIRSKELSDVVIIVARTFGGTLLGVPGLINAYKSAAEAAISNSEIISKKVTEKYSLIYTYDVIKEVNLLIRQFDLTVLSQKMEMKCFMDIEIERSAADNFIKRIKDNHILKEKCEIKVKT